MWFAIKPYKKWFFGAVAFVCASQAAAGLQSYVIKGFVDSANSYASQSGASLNTVFWWVLAFPLFSLLMDLSWRGSDYMMNYFTVNARMVAIKKIFSYLSLHSTSYFNDRLSGALSEKANNISGNVSRLTAQFIYNILSLIGYVAAAAVLIYPFSHLIVAGLLSFLLLLILLNYFLTKHQNTLSDHTAELSSKLRGQVVDAISNISAINQFARRSYEINRLDTAIIEYSKSDVKSDNYGNLVLLINNLLVTAFILCASYFSFTLWRDGAIMVGSLVMIINLLYTLRYGLGFIGQNLNEAMRVYGEMNNGLKEIVRPHEIINTRNARKLALDEGSVTFEGVSFSYGHDSKNIFDNLNLMIKGRQKIGIVGTSGAGKTTLMKLLMRQYDLQGGSILIDGQDIKEVTQESLRENVSIVPQEPVLFHRTIRENIMYGKLDATEEEMIEVAKKAQAHDFIEALPNKYDSLVGERGVKLSVGQRQRIAIARAFLKNAPILVLDEATSALDSESEVAVQKALHSLMEGKTVFAIAHRLSTLREMDRILVFKDGQIVEDGSHHSLVRHKEGVYASLWSHQAGGFLQED